MEFIFGHTPLSHTTAGEGRQADSNNQHTRPGRIEMRDRAMIRINSTPH